MGRHSAPDDTAPDETALDDTPADEQIPPVPDPVAAAIAASARHARPDNGARVEWAGAERTGVEQASAPQPAALASGSRGDLQLLRRDPWLRVRCAGAAVLIFLIYTTVIIVLGRGDVYLIWVWIPTVLTGVVVGALLDRSHRVLTGASPGRSGEG